MISLKYLLVIEESSHSYSNANTSLAKNEKYAHIITLMTVRKLLAGSFYVNGKKGISSFPLENQHTYIGERGELSLSLTPSFSSFKCSQGFLHRGKNPPTPPHLEPHLALFQIRKLIMVCITWFSPSPRGWVIRSRLRNAHTVPLKKIAAITPQYH